MAAHLTRTTVLGSTIDTWTLVPIRPKRVHWNDTVDPVSPVIQEMTDWLHDEQHAGVFWVDAMPLYEPIFQGPGRPILMAYIEKAEFYFNNADTAFMFKMRFA